MRFLKDEKDELNGTLQAVKERHQVIAKRYFQIEELFPAKQLAAQYFPSLNIDKLSSNAVKGVLMLSQKKKRTISPLLPMKNTH